MVLLPLMPLRIIQATCRVVARPTGAVTGPSQRILGTVLVVAGAAGSAAVLPLLVSVQGPLLQRLGADLRVVAVGTVLQTTALVAVAVRAGLVLGRRVGLGAPLLERFLAGESVLWRRALAAPATFG